MNDRNLYKNENECIVMLKYLFENAEDLLKEIAPLGWKNSQYVCFLHPTPEQQFEEQKRINENLNKLSKNSKPEIEIIKNSIENFAQDKLESINDKEEFIYILGLSIYDIFSNNHEVIGEDKRIYDFGSLRGSGGFIADFINDHMKDIPKHYDYIDFYMGSIWIKERSNIILFYEYVFQKLKRRNCNWKYTFPRLYIMELRNTEGNEKTKPESYNPEESVLKELEQKERENKINELREKLDETYKEEYEETKYKPLRKIVQAYKNIYGDLPDGHP